jgi:hypothetical protein
LFPASAHESPPEASNSVPSPEGPPTPKIIIRPVSGDEDTATVVFFPFWASKF